MQKNNILFLVGAALVFIFFVFFVPVHIVHGARVFYSFLILALVGVLMYFALKPSSNIIYTPENYNQLKSQKTVATVVAVVCGIVTLIIFLIYSNRREDDYLKKNATITTATIVDGEARTSTRKGSTTTTYSVDVEFTANKTTYKENLDINSTEWNKVGKGMDVAVVYAKDHPEICKILLDQNSINEYVKDGKFKQIDLATLGKIFSDKENVLSHLQNLSIGWKKQLSSEGNTFYYNSITQTVVYNNENFMYLSQINSSNDFNRMYNEVSSKYKKVYDSLATNKKVGAKYENDSFQVRLQQYNKVSEKEKGDNPYGIVMPSIDKVYTVGIANKNSILLLPGDLEDNLDEDPLKAAREIMLKKLNPNKHKSE